MFSKILKLLLSAVELALGVLFVMLFIDGRKGMIGDGFAYLLLASIPVSVVFICGAAYSALRIIKSRSVVKLQSILWGVNIFVIAASFYATSIHSTMAINDCFGRGDGNDMVLKGVILSIGTTDYTYLDRILQKKYTKHKSSFSPVLAMLRDEKSRSLWSFHKMSCLAR